MCQAKDIMISEIKEVIDSFKNTDILVDFYSPSYDVFYNKSKVHMKLLMKKFASNDYDEVVDWHYDLVTDNGQVSTYYIRRRYGYRAISKIEKDCKKLHNKLAEAHSRFRY